MDQILILSSHYKSVPIQFISPKSGEIGLQCLVPPTMCNIAEEYFVSLNTKGFVPLGA